MNNSDIIEYGEQLVARVDNMLENLNRVLLEYLNILQATIHSEMNHTHLIQSSNYGSKNTITCP